jgi:hypothetical protein
VPQGSAQGVGKGGCNQGPLQVSEDPVIVLDECPHPNDPTPPCGCDSRSLSGCSPRKSRLRGPWRCRRLLAPHSKGGKVLVRLVHVAFGARGRFLCVWFCPTLISEMACSPRGISGFRDASARTCSSHAMMESRLTVALAPPMQTPSEFRAKKDPRGNCGDANGLSSQLRRIPQGL